MKKLLAALLFIPSFAFAGSTLDFGFNRNNSESMSANINFKNTQSLGMFDAENAVSYMYKETNSEKTLDRLDSFNRLNLNINDRHYVQASLRLERDTLRTIENKYILALGHGFKIIDSERFKTSHELSLGYQFYKDNSSAVVRSNTKVSYKIADNLSAGNELMLEQGKDLITKNVTEIRIDLQKNITLSLDHTYLDQQVKTDNITAVKLGLRF
jgi:putative salt-induced outer membrane protein YdiY